MFRTITTQKAVLAATVFLVACGVTGCSMSSSPAAPAVVKGSAIKGRIFGGQQPVGFTTIQLYATGSAGYGSASTPLITSASVTGGTGTYPVTSDVNGNFTITNDYNCPTPASTPVYLTVTGGSPTPLVPNSTNPSLAMMIALGPCSGLANISFVTINELTTVASVWALAPFMSGIDHVGTSPTNPTGLANAFAAVNQVVNIANGFIAGPALPAGATLPVDEIAALGDILAHCINTTGGSAPGGTSDGTFCGDFFQNTTIGANVPADTVTAAMSMAQNPSHNATALFMEVGGVGAPFATGMTQAPNAWTIAINYTGGGLNHPQSIATDAGGNVWVANSGPGGTGGTTVSKFDNTGASLSGTTGFTGSGTLSTPYAIAVDTSGNAWVANAGNNTITEVASNGSGTAFSGNGLNVPKSIAIDTSGNLWVANNGANTVSAFTSAGVAIGNYSGGGITAPVAIGVDPK